LCAFVIPKASPDAVFYVWHIGFFDACPAQSRVHLIEKGVENRVTQGTVLSAPCAYALPDDIRPEEQPFAKRSREFLALKGYLQLVREEGIATEQSRVELNQAVRKVRCASSLAK